MNQRIQEFAEQQGLTGPNYYISSQELEKFAESIVRECAKICMEMSAKCAGLPGDGALAKDCTYWIKKDFGVV